MIQAYSAVGAIRKRRKETFTTFNACNLCVISNTTVLLTFSTVRSYVEGHKIILQSTLIKVNANLHHSMQIKWAMIFPFFHVFQQVRLKCSVLDTMNKHVMKVEDVWDERIQSKHSLLHNDYMGDFKEGTQVPIV